MNERAEVDAHCLLPFDLLRGVSIRSLSTGRLGSRATQGKISAFFFWWIFV